MQIRRLVKSGAASHTISLPKTWISGNNLKKGDLLYIDEDKNNIIISCKKEKKQEESEKEIVIQVDNQDTNTLRRKTISAYMNNYKIFQFIGDSLNKKLEDIRKILQNFLALEIVEESATKLVAKDFLNLQEFSLPNTVRRMDMLTRSMITDAKQGKKAYQGLYFRDFEVDKLFFLISRLIRANLMDPSTEVSNIHSHSTWWLAKNFESVSDCAKKLSRNFSKEMEDTYDEIEKYYLECAKAYFKGDRKLADQMIEKRGELLDKCDSLKHPDKHILKDMVNGSRNIAKIILDSES